MGVVVINVDGALTVSNVSLVDCGGYVRQFSRSTAGRDTIRLLESSHLLFIKTASQTPQTPQPAAAC